MEKVVTIRNNRTGHETTILKRSWDKASHLYKYYSLVDDPNVEYIDPEPKKEKVLRSYVAPEPGRLPEPEIVPEEKPKPKRRRKRKNNTTEN